MTKKRNAGLLAALMLLPLAALAEDLPSLAQVLATLRSAPAYNSMVPGAQERVVARNYYGRRSGPGELPHHPVTEDVCGNPLGQAQAGLRTATPQDVAVTAAPVQGQTIPAAPFVLYATPNGSGVVLTCGKPATSGSASIGLAADDGTVSAIVSDSRSVHGGPALFYFPALTVSGNKILYGGVTIGRINDYGAPVLNKGYSLAFSYGKTTYTDDGADPVSVNVQILGSRAIPTSVDIIAGPLNGGGVVSVSGGNPRGASVHLGAIESGQLHSVFQDNEGDRIDYVFMDVSIVNQEILYHGIVIGHVGTEGQPVLEAGFSLKYSYNATFNADRALVSAEIVSAAH